ncbi:LysR family transcriptional regulator [Piscinibacter koreensis]|uniref:LysR family transcriptional regulator n=1 Tax=Piscinibacter koreensis TaxID=2742824 RepID=A0A7Y6NQG9_9BURK|nr:LysR family transcriptional regulator [Schlegelella koreensis]NUZ07357.1 LysR family transcriptional regulator [Schlegelella koreensis]
MRDLIAVVETGSVRSAARKLGLAQAAVSKNLTALEKSLGRPLLVRSARGVEPTELGRIVLRRARVVEAELRHLQEEVERYGSEREDLVTVGLSATAEAMLLSDAVARFREVAPRAQISVFGGRSASTVGALREAKIDFAVGPLPTDQSLSDLHTEQLCSSDFGIFVRSDHPAADARDLAALLPYGWLYSVRQGGEPAIVSIMRERGLPEPTLIAHCDSSSALVDMLLQNDYVALNTLAALEPLRQRGLLKVLAIEVGLPPVVQYLMTPMMRPLTASAAALASEFRRASRRLRR